MSSLTILRLTKNFLTKLPVNFGVGLTSLTTLALDLNRLEEVPSSMSNAIQLQFLTLTQNKLSFLPNELTELIKLECLVRLNSVQ